jgi:hypothetical protein
VSTPYSPSNRQKIITPGNTLPGVTAQSDISRVLPRQLSTGSTRGTQTVGYGTAKLDGSNNRISVGAPDGSSVGMGSIPGSTTNEYGFFSLDSTGNLVMKIVNGTKYVYDPAHNYVNVTQDGLLPDGSGGFVAAKPGINVDTLFA